jgi:hypothetical protein
MSFPSTADCSASVQPSRNQITWFQHWRHTYGFPDNYVCFAVQTTGLDRWEHLPLEFAHVLVQRGAITDEHSFRLRWSSHPEISRTFLEDRLTATREQMAAKGRPYSWTYKMIEAADYLPEDGLDLIDEYFRIFAASHYHLVGHMGLKFDLPFVREHLKMWRFKELAFAEDHFFDTGLAAGACRKAERPRRGELLPAFWERACLSNLLASLDSSLKEYGVSASPILDGLEPGSALFKARAAHLLVESFRAIGA